MKYLIAPNCPLSEAKYSAKATKDFNTINNKAHIFVGFTVYSY